MSLASVTDKAAVNCGFFYLPICIEMNTDSNQRKRCFPPVVNADTRVLILGSLPGEASLAAGQYYAHPRNQFWPLVGSLLQLDLPALPYAQRLGCLLQHGIGLWDVIAEARRHGSLDTSIRDSQHNDLQQLLASLPKLALVAFNGKTAGKQATSLAGCGVATLILPSSSPAFTLPFAAKQAAWRALASYIPTPRSDNRAADQA